MTGTAPPTGTAPGSYVGVDLGGTKILAARVDIDADGGAEVTASAKQSTPTSSLDDVIDALVERIREVGDGAVAVGLGTPGVVEPGSGVVAHSPNVTGFDRPVHLADRLGRALGAGVALANDVNVAALGEVRAGAAAGRTDVLAAWMGTGLGAGLILDGVLRTGPTGLAGELGHITVVRGGRPCACGGRGHLEAYIGRRALETHARAEHDRGRTSLLVERAGKKRMKSKAFRAAYDDGDDVTVEMIHEGLDHLGLAVGNLAVAADIGTIVIGGGLGERFADVAVERIDTVLDDVHYGAARPDLAVAGLGDHSGTIGAAFLAAESQPVSR